MDKYALPHTIKEYFTPILLGLNLVEQCSAHPIHAQMGIHLIN